MFSDFNLSDITTNSLNNLSDLSDMSELSPLTFEPAQNGGGFIHNLLFGSTSSIDKDALDAARDKNFAVVEFLIQKNHIKNFAAKDKDGNTLLHYLVSVPNPNKSLINVLLQNKSVKSFINAQNKDGDTPLLLAVKSGHHDLCYELEKAGADKKIKNNSGHNVDTETEIPEENVFKATVGPLENGTKMSPKEVDNILAPIKALLFNAKQSPKTSEPGPLTLSASVKDTPEFIKQQHHKLNSKDSETENLIKQLENKQTGGSLEDTADSLVTAISHYNQAGGFISGTRKLNHYSNDTKRYGELGKLVNDKTGDIINQTIKNIQQIISDNKKDFKGIKDDETTARAFKSLVWKSIKDAHPELKSSLDVAVEMEKVISKDELKKYSAKQIREMVDILSKKQSEREERLRQSSTSDVSVSTDSGFLSLTSDDY